MTFAHLPPVVLPTRAEASRRAMLRSLEILDTAAEPAFDALVQTASLLCRCPISLMSLIDVDRQWFKAAVGVDATETPRDQAFCAHAICGDDLFLVPDATRDERFAANPLVTGDPQVRFYAGQPILFDGVALGTLCVIDRVPRDLDAEQRKILRHLAMVMGELLQGRLDRLSHRRESDRLLAFARLSGDWLWETDETHRCSWISGDPEEAAELFDGPALGASFRDAQVYDRTGQPIADATLDGLFAGGRAFSDAILEVVTPTGVRFISIGAEPIASDDDGERDFRGFRGSARDVTVHIRAEREVRERQAVLHKVASHVPGLIYQFRRCPDGTACMPYASEGIRDVWELSPEEVREDAAAMFERIHRGDIAAIQESIAVSHDQGTVWNALFRVVLPVKGVRWIRSSSMPEVLADGGTLWHGYSSDVTEAHKRDCALAQAHEALQAAQRRLVSLTDNLPALISYVDRDERYTFVSRHHHRVFGERADDYIGRRVREVRADIYPQLEPHIERVMAGHRVEFEGASATGDTFKYFQTSFVPEMDSSGDVVGFYSMTFDLTARREVELNLLRSQKRLLDITNNIPAVIGEFDLDGRCLFANDLALRSHGLTRADMPSLTFRSPISDSHYEQMAGTHADVLAGRGGAVQGTREVDGLPNWFESHFVPSVDDAGVQRGFYVTTFDITTLKMAEIERAISELRLRQLTDNLPVMISTCDVEERTTYVNERLRASLGKKMEELIGRTAEENLGPHLYAQRRAYFKRCLAGEQVAFEIESVVDGETRHFQAIYLPNPGVDGRIVGMTTVRFDVTDRKRAEHRLSQLAHSDTLTGLPNRLRFNDEIARILATTCDGAAPTAVMFLDVDRFKTVNDTHGHAVGDAVLKEFARRIRHGVRPTDFVARLSGDEFVIVLERVRPEEVSRIAAKIVDEVARPFRVEQRQLAITTSIGIAFRDPGTTTPAALLAKADVALYRAKEEGRNTFRLAA